MAKTMMKAKQRSLFTACGEESTYNQTYSGVQKRPLPSFPRLAKSQKEEIVGRSLDEFPTKLLASASAGHPLFWQEVKPIGLLSQILQDLCVSHVIDLSPGSGACATAAAMNAITYDGFCYNTAQQQWLESVIDRTMLGVLTDEKGPNKDTDFAQSIRMYFAASIGNLLNDVPSDKTPEQPHAKRPKRAPTEQRQPSFDDDDTKGDRLQAGIDRY